MPPLGEFELIERFLERLPTTGGDALVASGDDAAVARVDGPVVVSVDSLVEGVHFTRPAFSMQAIGKKALGAALSDLAAMGAEPLHAYVVVGIPDDTDGDAVLELADGLAESARRNGVSILGGDVTRAPSLMLSVTVVGRETEGCPAVTRSAAQPGDLVAVTGTLGGAAAALALMAAGDEAPEGLLDRQLDPVPRLGEGMALARVGASAMIDLSDGLLADAAHIARSSGVTIHLETDRLPVDPRIEQAGLTAAEAKDLAMSGGEDYELLACVDADSIELARSECSCDLTVIGRVGADEGLLLVDAESGEPLPPIGFDHLRGD